MTTLFSKIVQVTKQNPQETPLFDLFYQMVGRCYHIQTQVMEAEEIRDLNTDEFHTTISELTTLLALYVINYRPTIKLDDVSLTVNSDLEIIKELSFDLIHEVSALARSEMIGYSTHPRFICESIWKVINKIINTIRQSANG